MSIGKAISGGIGGGLAGSEIGHSIGGGNPWITGGAAGLGALGGFLGSGYDPNRGPTKHDREPFHKQIQWRVTDAKKAGIHPLYALGMPAASSTQSVGTGSGSGNIAVDSLNAVAGHLSRRDAKARQDRIDRQQTLESSANIAATRAQARAANAQAMRDMVLAQKTLSDVARAKVNINAQQDRSKTPYIAPTETVRDGQITGGREGATLNYQGFEHLLGQGVPTETVEAEHGGIIAEIYGVTKWLREHGMSSDQLGVSKGGKNPHQSKRW